MKKPDKMSNPCPSRKDGPPFVRWFEDDPDAICDQNDRNAPNDLTI